MLRIILKALIIIWPFLKNIAFKDQTIQEAIQANRQFTYLFVLTMIVVLTLMVTSLALSETKEKLQVMQDQLDLLTKQNTELNKTNGELADAIDKDSRSVHCPTDFYDKSRIIELLD